MSVLVRNRTLSKLEFYKNAINLRKKVTLLLLRDIGIKNRIRTLRIDIESMDQEDANSFSSIVEKYNIGEIADEHPGWLIDNLRQSIWDLLRDMMINITRAYTIWATNISEAYEMRNAQNRAIADCESLLKELELAVEVLPINAEKYMPYVDIIDREIALLKGWRKSDNKRIKELQGK